MILGIFFCAWCLLVWFDTHAFQEYAELFRLSKLFKLDQYKEINYQGTYLEFLNEFFPGFIVRLISCAICSSVWFAGAAVFLYGLSIKALPMISLSGLVLYKFVKKAILD